MNTAGVTIKDTLGLLYARVLSLAIGPWSCWQGQPTEITLLGLDTSYVLGYTRRCVWSMEGHGQCRRGRRRRCSRGRKIKMSDVTSQRLDKRCRHESLTFDLGRPPPEPDFGEVIRFTHRLVGNPPPPLNFSTRTSLSPLSRTGV